VDEHEGGSSARLLVPQLLPAHVCKRHAREL
jgi:hypothetical protein